MELKIEKFSPNKAEVMAMLDECKNLEIKGINDRKGYELVHKARIALKNKRWEYLIISRNI